MDFYLLILGEYSVDRAYISFGSGNVINLDRVMGIKHLWRCNIPIPCDVKELDRIKYRYGIHSKGHDFKLPFWGRVGIFSTDPSYCDERAERRIRSEIQFDVFHYPDSRNYQYQTVPQSVVFYVQWLLRSIFPSTIAEYLKHIKGLNFKSLNGTKYAEDIVNWIVKQTSSNSVTDAQCLYLCIIMGHIEEDCWKPLTFPSGNKTAEACDRLLRAFNGSSDLLSASNIKIVKKVAILLVKNSNSPGWLTFAAYFYPYLGIKFLLSKEYASGLNHRYGIREYEDRIQMLFLNIKEMKSKDDQFAHRELLRVMLQSAPTLNSALGLFKRSDFLRFFANENEMVNFFVKFYEDRQRDTSTSKEIGAKLIEYFQIPEIFRNKMHKLLYPIMLEYAKSDGELKGEHVKMFVSCIVNGSALPLEQVSALLTELSNSKSVPRQNLLLQILDNELFETKWHEIKQAQKVEICNSWVLLKVNTKWRTKGLFGVDKTVSVYEAIDQIMRCSLNVKNTPLAEDVSTYVVEKALAKEDTINILQAFAAIEGCVPIVQECYKSHVRKLLIQTPKVVKKSSKFLQKYSSSRYVLISIKYGLSQEHVFVITS